MSKIHYIDNTDLGAPSLTNAASSMIEVLRAALVTGFNVRSVASIAVTSGVALVTCAAHGFAAHAGKLVQISGAPEALLNGAHQPQAVTTNSFEFDAPGVADGAYTGTISARRAPLGWAEPFTGTNVAVFRSQHAASVQTYLRVSDPAGDSARVVGYEDMTDHSAGTAAFPLNGQVPGGLYWFKSANAAAREWAVVGDDRAFYIFTAPYTSGQFGLWFFGDYTKQGPAHAFATAIAGNLNNAQNVTIAYGEGDLGFTSRQARGGVYVARSYTDLGGALSAAQIGIGYNGPIGSPDTKVYAGAAGYSFGAYPNGPNNGLLVAPLGIYVDAFYGVFPGLLHPVQNLASSGFSNGAVVTATDDLAGRKLLLRTVRPTGSGSGGYVALDITGPWEYLP